MTFFQKQNKGEPALRKSALANGNYPGIGFDSVRHFAFRNKCAQKSAPMSGSDLLLYNVHMSETKAVRLTETVKAAG